MVLRLDVAPASPRTQQATRARRHSRRLADNSPPVPTVTADAARSQRRHDGRYTLTYTDASSFDVLLDADAVTLTAEDGANTPSLAVLPGAGPNSRIIELSSLTGDGVVGVTLDAGAAVDTVGNSTPEQALDPIIVDNAIPAPPVVTGTALTNDATPT